MKQCKERRTGRQLAAKFIDINGPQDRKDIINEVEIMKVLQHPRLLQLYDAFENRTSVCIVTELWVWITNLFLLLLLYFLFISFSTFIWVCKFPRSEILAIKFRKLRISNGHSNMSHCLQICFYYLLWKLFWTRRVMCLWFFRSRSWVNSIMRQVCQEFVFLPCFAWSANL